MAWGFDLWTLNKKERRKKEFDFSNLFLYVLLCVLMVGTAEGYGC